MKGKCLWCGKEFEEGEGYSWPDYCTRECYYNWVGATAHVRAETEESKTMGGNPQGEAIMPGDVGILRLTFEQGHTLRYLVEQDLIRVRGSIVTAKIAIKTGPPPIPGEVDPKVSLKHYEFEKGPLEELLKEIKDFLAILQRASEQEQHIR